MPDRFLLDEMEEQPALVERLLREQPAAIARALAGRPRRPRRIWFTGCGDMRFAGRIAAAWARRVLGLEIGALPAMDLRWRRAELAAEDLLVVGSISGRTPRAIEAARAARAAGAMVLAVTDDPRAGLAREANAVIELNTSAADDLAHAAYAGYARPVPQTKTFTAALVTEMLIAAHLAERETPRELMVLPSVMRDLLARSERELPALVTELAAARSFSVLGSGPFAALASYGAAKLLEYALPSHAQCLEEFQHLELFVTGADTGLILLAPDLASSSRAREITSAYDELGCPMLVLGEASEQPARAERRFAWTPANLTEALVGLAIPLQRLAHDVALRHGRDVNAWVGGVRGDLILRLSQRVVRGSEVRD
jgi:glucosamine--fructose-6-phosphate aminotransferase (isomerizing)